MKKLILFISMLLCLQIEAQRTSTGIVTRIVDADTWITKVKSYHGKEATIKIRIMNADAPELYSIPKRRKAQPFSMEAKLFATNLLEGKSVDITYNKTDMYGRVLSYVRMDGQRVDSILIIKGMAWAFNAYGTKQDVKKSNDLMEKAKKANAGLWSLPNPIKPSDWRKGIMSYSKAGQVLMDDGQNKQWIDTPISTTKSLTAKYKTRLDSLNNLVYDLQRRMFKLEQKMSSSK
jgi:micrococcal nuclease